MLDMVCSMNGAAQVVLLRAVEGYVVDQKNNAQTTTEI